MDEYLDKMFESFLRQRSNSLGWMLEYDDAYSKNRDCYFAGYKQAIIDLKQNSPSSSIGRAADL